MGFSHIIVFVFAVIGTSIASPYHWQDYYAGQPLPSNAVLVGVKSDGSHIYTGRTMYEGQLQTVTYYPKSEEAYISYGGGRKRVYQFQLLINYLSQFEPIWSKSGNGQLPRNAVECGFTAANEPLYMARVWKDGYAHPAKYSAYMDVCHFVDGDREGRTYDCDILVSRIDGYDWIGTVKNKIPADWFVSCQDPSGRNVGIGYTYYNDERTLVKLIPETQYASINCDGRVIELDDNQVIHVLVQHVKTKPLAWRQVQAHEDYSNKDLLQAGYTHDGRVIQIGRFQHDGHQLLGKVIRHHASNENMCVPIDGNVGSYPGNFEVLYLPTHKEI